MKCQYYSSIAFANKCLNKRSSVYGFIIIIIIIYSTIHKKAQIQYSMARDKYILRMQGDKGAASGSGCPEACAPTHATTST